MGPQDESSGLTPPPADLCDAIRSASRVALAGHVTPDADCIGAIGALWLALPELNVTPVVSLPTDTVARRLRFLVEHAAIPSSAPGELRSADLVIALDTAKYPRLNVDGGREVLDGKPIINIDHHATNTQFGQWNWISGQRSSTSEMVYDLLLTLGCQITPTIGTLIFAGIHTDTQGFSLSNTTSRSLAVGHEVTAAGARVHEVCERLHRSHSRSEFALMQVIYGNTRVSDDGRLAWSTASFDEIRATGCNANDIDNQVEVPRSVEGIDIALLLSEGVNGKVRINFRGEGGRGVLDLARQFNGGGHHASAGAIVDGPLKAVTERVVAAAREYLNSPPPEA